MRVWMRTVAPDSGRGGSRNIEAPPWGRFYYGWVIVAVLALTVTISYGILMYAFPVVLAAMQAELGWSQQMLTGGYSLGALVGGLAAIPIGRWLDKHGPRGVMTVSAIVASILVASWAHVSTPLGFYLVWIGLGVSSAGLFYEPAFTTIAQWFDSQRSRALTVITVAGGLASTIFVPVTAALTAQLGWRGAVMSLAGLLAAFTILPHALALRRRPGDVGLAMDVRPPAAAVPNSRNVNLSARALLRSTSFRWLTATFCLSTATNIAFAIHLIPLLLARGHPLAFASLTLGSVGIMKLVGRLLIGPLVDRTTVSTATTIVFGLQAIGLILLTLSNSSLAIWACVVLFGIGDGASTPARAELVAQLYDISIYGSISGVMALFLAGARAIGPVGASLVFALTGGYRVPLVLMSVLLLWAGWILNSATKARGGPAMRQ